MAVLVDTQAAVDELGIDLSDFMELCGELKDFIATTIPQLKKADEDDDKKSLEEVAHSLKGALKNLRFIQGGDLGETLEKIGAGRDDSSAADVLENLKVTLDNSIKELNL